MNFLRTPLSRLCPLEVFHGPSFTKLFTVENKVYYEMQFFFWGGQGYPF